MKKLLSITSTILFTVLMIGQAMAMEIAVVDTNKIFEESKPGKDVVAYLDTIQKEMIKKLEGIEEKRKKIEKDESQKELLANLEKEMQATAYEAQTKIQATQEKIFAIVSAKLIETIEKYRKDNKIAMIFHASDLISFDKKIDVTNAIMQEFNKIKIDFDKELNKK